MASLPVLRVLVKTNTVSREVNTGDSVTLKLRKGDDINNLGLLFDIAGA